MWIPAVQISPGDVVDLRRDRYSQPRLPGDGPLDAVLVMSVWCLEDERVQVSFGGFDVVAFPSAHYLRKVGHRPLKPGPMAAMLTALRSS